MADLPEDETPGRDYEVAPDTLLPVLDLAEMERSLGSATAKADLFRLFIDLHQTKLAPTAGDSVADPGNGQLPFRVPGTPVVVRLREWEMEEAKALIAFAIGVVASGHISLGTLSAGAVLAAFTRFRALKPALGELSVYEAIRRLQPASSSDIARQLYGRPCLRPDAGCRYVAQRTQTCGMTVSQTEDVLRALLARRVVAVWNAGAQVEQYEVRT